MQQNSVFFNVCEGVQGSSNARNYSNYALIERTHGQESSSSRQQAADGTNLSEPVGRLTERYISCSSAVTMRPRILTDLAKGTLTSLTLVVLGSQIVVGQIVISCWRDSIVSP